MKNLERLFAEKLLKIKAIKLQTGKFRLHGLPDGNHRFTATIVKPFLILLFVVLLSSRFTRLVLERFGQVDAIAGVATGAIPQGALVADALNLPFVYVRSTPKDHGLENLIEGELRPGMKVVVVEDLISTGGSSLKAVEAIRRDGCEVIGMVAAYTYGFPVAEQAFKDAKVPLVTLTNYEAVLDVALRTGYIEEEDIATLNRMAQGSGSLGNRKIKLFF